jgi:hypothetical protein
MVYVVAALVVIVMAAVAYFMRQGAKIEKGRAADAHREGDEEFHARGEDFDAADPFGSGMSDDKD